MNTELDPELARLPIVDAMVRLAELYNQELRGMKPGLRYIHGVGMGREYLLAEGWLSERAGLERSDLTEYFSLMSVGEAVPLDVMKRVAPVLRDFDNPDRRLSFWRYMRSRAPHVASKIRGVDDPDDDKPIEIVEAIKKAGLKGQVSASTVRVDCKGGKLPFKRKTQKKRSTYLVRPSHCREKYSK